MPYAAAGELSATRGDIKPHPHVCIGRYNQHSAEQLDPEKTAGSLTHTHGISQPPRLVCF